LCACDANVVALFQFLLYNYMQFQTKAHILYNVNGLGPPTSPRACEDVLTNCKAYSMDACTNPDYDLWVEDNCRKYCGRCK